MSHSTRFDCSEIHLPENSSALNKYARTGVGGFLDRRIPPDRIIVDPTGLNLPSYGNPAENNVDFQTFGEMVKSGRVLNLDGFAIFPVVSDNAEIQAAYRELRKAGESHETAILHSI